MMNNNTPVTLTQKTVEQVVDSLESQGFDVLDTYDDDTEDSEVFDDGLAHVTRGGKRFCVVAYNNIYTHWSEAKEDKYLTRFAKKVDETLESK